MEYNKSNWQRVFHSDIELGAHAEVNTTPRVLNGTTGQVLPSFTTQSATDSPPGVTSGIPMYASDRLGSYFERHCSISTTPSRHANIPRVLFESDFHAPTTPAMIQTPVNAQHVESFRSSEPHHVFSKNPVPVRRDDNVLYSYAHERAPGPNTYNTDVFYKVDNTCETIPLSQQPTGNVFPPAAPRSSLETNTVQTSSQQFGAQSILQQNVQPHSSTGAAPPPAESRNHYSHQENSGFAPDLNAANVFVPPPLNPARQFAAAATDAGRQDTPVTTYVPPGSHQVKWLYASPGYAEQPLPGQSSSLPITGSVPAPMPVHTNPPSYGAIPSVTPPTHAPTRQPHLPEFFNDQPRTWFAVVESIFNSHQIFDDNTRYTMLLSHVHKFYELLSDVFLHPPSHNKYETLKNALIERSSKSTSEMLTRIVYVETLEDRTPSQLWRRLRAMVPPAVLPDDALWTIWSMKLPTALRITLLSHFASPMDLRLRLADEAYVLLSQQHTTPPTRQPSAANLPTSQPHATSFTHSSTPTVGHTARADKQSPARATTLATRRTTESAAFPTGGSTSPSHSAQQLTPSLATQANHLCWFHATFGDKAVKCRQPCNYPNASDGEV